MTISNDSRDRIKHVFEPIALGLGRIGLTPNGLTLIGFGITVVGAVLVGLEDHRRDRRADPGGGGHERGDLRGWPSWGTVDGCRINDR